MCPHLIVLLQDPSFTSKLKLLQTDPKALSGILGGAGGLMSDPRMMEVIAYLLGAEIRTPEEMKEEAAAASAAEGSGSEAASGASKAAAEAKRKREQEEEAERLRKEQEEAEAADPELAAKRERKRQAVAKKEEGNGLYKQKKFDEALAAYKAAAELDNEDITYLINQAAVHFETGDLDACIATCRAAIERGREIFAPFPLIGKAFTRIGNAEYKRGNLADAIEAYERSLMESHRCVSACTAGATRTSYTTG